MTVSYIGWGSVLLTFKSISYQYKIQQSKLEKNCQKLLATTLDYMNIYTWMRRKVGQNCECTEELPLGDLLTWPSLTLFSTIFRMASECMLTYWFGFTNINFILSVFLINIFEIAHLLKFSRSWFIVSANCYFWMNYIAQ